MTADNSDVSALQDLHARLEQALIDEFLLRHGYQPARHSLDALPDSERKLLMSHASAYASGKLAEVDARAHFVQQMHGDIEEAHRPHR